MRFPLQAQLDSRGGGSSTTRWPAAARCAWRPRPARTAAGSRRGWASLRRFLLPEMPPERQQQRRQTHWRRMAAPMVNRVRRMTELQRHTGRDVRSCFCRCHSPRGCRCTSTAASSSPGRKILFVQQRQPRFVRGGGGLARRWTWYGSYLISGLPRRFSSLSGAPHLSILELVQYSSWLSLVGTIAQHSIRCELLLQLTERMAPWRKRVMRAFGLTLVILQNISKDPFLFCRNRRELWLGTDMACRLERGDTLSDPLCINPTCFLCSNRRELWLGTDMARASARRAAWNEALLREGVAAVYARTLLRAAQVGQQIFEYL